MQGKEYIKVYDHGDEEFDFFAMEGYFQVSCTEVHYRQDGTLGGNPSIAFLCPVKVGAPVEPVAVNQISMKTLNDVLGVLGYSIIKLKDKPTEGEIKEN